MGLRQHGGQAQALHGLRRWCGGKHGWMRLAVLERCQQCGEGRVLCRLRCQECARSSHTRGGLAAWAGPQARSGGLGHCGGATGGACGAGIALGGALAARVVGSSARLGSCLGGRLSRL